MGADIKWRGIASLLMPHLPGVLVPSKLLIETRQSGPLKTQRVRPPRDGNQARSTDFFVDAGADANAEVECGYSPLHNALLLWFDRDVLRHLEA